MSTGPRNDGRRYLSRQTPRTANVNPKVRLDGAGDSELAWPPILIETEQWTY